MRGRGTFEQRNGCLHKKDNKKYFTELAAMLFNAKYIHNNCDSFSSSHRGAGQKTKQNT